MRFLQIAESLTACRELQLLGTSLGPELEDQINEAMAWPYLEEELVDESGSDPSQDGARPVDPVIGPGAEDQGRPEGPGGVHAGAREGDGEQVAGGDGETDGQGSRALHTLGVVTVGSRGEHHRHQHHRDDELDTEALASRDLADAGDANSLRGFVRGNENTENTGSDGSSDALSQDVEESLEESQLGPGDEARGDGGVDVTAGDVSEGLCEGGHSHPETESDLHHSAPLQATPATH